LVKKLKINGLMEDSKIAWKKIPCCCGTEVMDKFPLKECHHCRCQRAEDSMPRNEFETININPKTNKEIKWTVKEITIDRTDDGFDSIRGWQY